MADPELKVGRRLEWSRAFSETEVRAFSALSGDTGVHHLEHDEKGRLMVHGLLTATLPTKLGGDLDYIARTMTFEFLRPVYAGEEIRCVATVVYVRAERGSTAAGFTYEATNPKGKTVLRGKTEGIIRARA